MSMRLSLPRDELRDYIGRQLDHFFPDGNTMRGGEILTGRWIWPWTARSTASPVRLSGAIRMGVEARCSLISIRTNTHSFYTIFQTHFGSCLKTSQFVIS